MPRSGAAQVVGHRIAEGLQFRVGRLQLGGALLHPLLQLLVQAADVVLRLHALGDVAAENGYPEHLAVPLEQVEVQVQDDAAGRDRVVFGKGAFGQGPEQRVPAIPKAPGGKRSSWPIPTWRRSPRF